MPRPREIVMRFLAEPGDVNYGGKVHGGAVMRWIDQAGYACAAGWSRRYCVTALVSEIRFVRPIFIGHIVEVHALLARTGTTSMEIDIRVSSADPRTRESHRNTECAITFVALDEAGRPTPVAPLRRREGPRAAAATARGAAPSLS